MRAFLIFFTIRLPCAGEERAENVYLNWREINDEKKNFCMRFSLDYGFDDNADIGVGVEILWG